MELSSSSSPIRGLLAIVQGAVYIGAAWELWGRWPGDTIAFLVAAAFQVVASGGFVSGRRAVAGVGGLGSLVAVGFVWARFFHVAMTVRAEFGPETSAQAAQTFGATVVAIPWLLALPITQLWWARWAPSSVALLLAPLPGLLAPGEAVARAPGGEALPGFRVPTTRMESRWSPGPGVTPSSVDDAVAAGARHLIGNMNGDGRFTYIVKGPSGADGPGYNYPRHAGTAWFLARSDLALGVGGEAADRAVQHLATISPMTDDGRAYVHDPARNDGRAWVGTTALAVMALATRPEGATNPILASWVRQLAASVDDTGRVRGEMEVRTGRFQPQQANPYGQGQVMLGLAIAERAGVRDGADALTRTIAYVNADYYGSGNPVWVADEHWMCLAEHAIRTVRGVDAGTGVCRAYVTTETWNAPVDGGGLPPSAGPAGGAAEAVVARAWGTRDPALLELAPRYGTLFLANQYREEDAPRLGRPGRLIGGFRDSSTKLDVQIDAVQHIGCALLGVEALLSQRDRPGAFP